MNHKTDATLDQTSGHSPTECQLMFAPSTPDTHGAIIMRTRDVFANPIRTMCISLPH